MSQPYVGQILMVGFNFAPAGWAMCNGQSLPISENETLFQLIGTMYGGDGEETFNLPNMQSRVPVHMGQSPGVTQNYQIAETGGVESVTLTTQQIPTHNHAVLALQAAANSSAPGNNILATETVSLAQANSFSYGAFGGTQSTLGSNTIQPAGGSQPHENLQPYLTVTFIIALFGVFPSQN